MGPTSLKHGKRPLYTVNTSQQLCQRYQDIFNMYYVNDQLLIEIPFGLM